MLVLDTDHLTEFGFQSRPGKKLSKRLAETNLPVVISVISVQEQIGGIFASINRIKQTSVRELALAYESLTDINDFLAGFTCLPFDSEAATLFLNLRQQGIKIGTMDLRIACIVMEHDATLLTRNTVDFEKVPGLKFENWLK